MVAGGLTLGWGDAGLFGSMDPRRHRLRTESRSRLGFGGPGRIGRPGAPLLTHRADRPALLRGKDALHSEYSSPPSGGLRRHKLPLRVAFRTLRLESERDRNVPRSAPEACPEELVARLPEQA